MISILLLSAQFTIYHLSNNLFFTASHPIWLVCAKRYESGLILKLELTWLLSEPCVSLSIVKQSVLTAIAFC